MKRSVFPVGLLLISWLTGADTMAQDLVPPIPFRTGNLSVGYLKAVVQSKEIPPEGMLTQLDKYREMGILRVEDYVTLLALERSPNQWDWSYYDRNYEKVKEAGLEYGVYPWLHFAPDWYWTGASPKLDGFVNAKTGREIRMPSTWAPSTRQLYEMVYQRLKEHFGTRIDYFNAALPVDYGEVGYPAGMANWLVPVEGCEPGLWCGDKYARRDFRLFALERYGDVEGINQAWGTSWETAAEITYPADPSHRRYWLDFVGWYYDSMTKFTVWTVDVARKFFPEIPIAVKVGHGSERYLYGSDYTMVPKMAAERGFICSYPGAIDYFPCKRIATACHFYGAATCTEPPGGVDATKEVERLFFDVCLGADEHFNYPGNLLGHPEVVRKYAPLLTGEDPVCPLAVFFPTTTHRLRPEEHFPHRLLVCCNPLRDLTDYDIVDEQMIRDGAVDGYGILLCPEVNVIETETVPFIESWVKGGGILLTAPSANVETVEGATVAILGSGSDEEAIGSGIVLRPKTTLADEQVPKWVAHVLRGRIPELRPALARKFPDLQPDGVLVCSFPNRVVAFNRNQQPASAVLRLPPDGQPTDAKLQGREIRTFGSSAKPSQ
jgi:hypothetical protein